jgi:hypothetical protein
VGLTIVGKVRAVLVLIPVVVCLSACSGTREATSVATTGTPKPLWLEDVTAASGIRFAPEAVAADPYFMPALMSVGAAVIDFDDDGRLDIFLAPGGPHQRGTPSKLYRQTEQGRFVDVTRSAGVEVHGYGQGAAAGDVNNDGRVDLLVTAYGRVWLFLNGHDGRFIDVTASAGVESPLWSVSGVFTDIDRDGWLDLLLVNYVSYSDRKQCYSPGGQLDFCGPRAFKGTAARLFRNRGTDHGTSVSFEDITLSSGLASAPAPGLGAVSADFDGDGWLDLFVANDGAANHLWLNRRNGRFEESAVLLGLAYNAMGRAEANMGIAFGDLDNDGRFDLFVTHLTDERHRVWLQRKTGQFLDSTARFGLVNHGRSTGFGTAFADFDNDGDEDLIYVNGRVAREGHDPPAGPGQPFWSPYAERNFLFENDGSTMIDVTEGSQSFAEPAGVYRVAIVADMDNDGGVDAFVTRVDGEARLFRNVAARRGHWIGLRAIDPALKRDAYDAVITARAGDRSWTRWLNPAKGFATSMDPRAHVGLGSTDRIDAFIVDWPDGTREAFPGTGVDRYVTLSKGSGRPAGSQGRK